MKLAYWSILTSCFVLAIPVLCAAAWSGAQANNGKIPPRPLPGGQGKVIMERICTGCHSLSVVTSRRATPTEWNSVVQQMISRGAAGTDQEIDTLTRYLAANFGPGAPAYETPVASPATPAAASREAAESSAGAHLTAHRRSSIQVNVNRASAGELESALSLTAEEALTLIQYRKRNGKFQNWQEVGEIPGVPAGKIIEYQDRIVF